MNEITISLFAFLGGITCAILGWLDSKEKFNTQKFAKSVINSLFVAIVFGIGYSSANIEIKDMFVALASGAGFDSITNRAIGAIRSK